MRKPKDVSAINEDFRFLVDGIKKASPADKSAPPFHLMVIKSQSDIGAINANFRAIADALRGLP